MLIIAIIFNLLGCNWNASQSTKTTIPENRPSITFILGEDEKESNQFYDLAKHYYLYNPTNKTEYFVDTCRSLVSVRNYLENNISEDKATWGKINVVLHSNQWTGLSVPVTEGGHRTTVESLFNSIQENEFKSLPNELIDAQTEMNFKACGLGSNTDLLNALQIAFGGFDDEKPRVQSSEHFIYYQFDQDGHIASKQFKPYYAFYRTAYRPAEYKLAQQLKEKYPTENIDWIKAMNNKKARFEGDVFHCRFNVPIEWEVVVDAGSMKNCKTEKQKLAFVRSQKDLMDKLEKFNIPIEKFRWTFSSKKQDGKLLVTIKGKSTVLCILKETK